MNNKLCENPLISVIIPCYNHGHYLQEAFESIYSQAYPNIEIIVVDDGSADNTREVTEKNALVKYIYQENKGLSAARNTGIKNSNGDLLIFLDADDWLLPGAILTNLRFLKDNVQSAFVSGGYRLVFENSGKITDTTYEVHSDHYIHFLESNYIGMHAAVMYQRWVFDEFDFEETLRACEDYDLYLRVANKYPVFHHEKIIAAYRMHNSNMSSNIPAMLASVLKVLKRQKENLKTAAQKKAYKTGRFNWKKYYCEELYEKLNETKTKASQAELLILVKYYPFLATKYLLKKIIR